MNSKLYSVVTVIAVAFALVLGFGTLNPAKAIQGAAGDGYALAPGQVNLYGLDMADNSVRVIDRDAEPPRPITNAYGLWGTSRQ